MGTDKYIKVAYGNFVIRKQTGQVQMKILDYNGNSFIATLYNILFAPDLYD